MNLDGNQATPNNFSKEERMNSEEDTESKPKLPEEWKWKTLGDVAQINRESRNPSVNSPGEEFIYIDISSIGGGNGRIIEVKRILGKNAPSRARRVIHKDDVVMSTVRPYLRSFAVVPKEYANQICSTGLAVLTCKEGTLPKYLLYCLFSDIVIEQCNSLMMGAHYPAINQKQVKSIQIPVPPVEEQKRVVSRIEEITSRIEQAKKLREAALKDAEAIMQSALHQAFSKTEEKGWKWVRLGDAIETLKNGIYKPARFYGKGYPCLRMYNIKDRRIVLRDIKYLQVTPKELEEYGLLPNDILINRVNSLELVGKAALISDAIGPCTFESKNIRMRVKENLVMPSFLVYLLDSQIIREQISKLAKPIIGQATINQKDIVSLKVPTPSIEEQKHITSVFDNLQGEVDMLQRQQEKTKREIEVLTQAILKKAFNGQL